MNYCAITFVYWSLDSGAQKMIFKTSNVGETKYRYVALSSERIFEPDEQFLAPQHRACGPDGNSTTRSFVHEHFHVLLVSVARCACVVAPRAVHFRWHRQHLQNAVAVHFYLSMRRSNISTLCFFFSWPNRAFAYVINNHLCIYTSFVLICYFEQSTSQHCLVS